MKTISLAVSLYFAGLALAASTGSLINNGDTLGAVAGANTGAGVDTQGVNTLGAGADPIGDAAAAAASSTVANAGGDTLSVGADSASDGSGNAIGVDANGANTASTNTLRTNTEGVVAEAGAVNNAGTGDLEANGGGDVPPGAVDNAGTGDLEANGGGDVPPGAGNGGLEATEGGNVPPGEGTVDGAGANGVSPVDATKADGAKQIGDLKTQLESVGGDQSTAATGATGSTESLPGKINAALGQNGAPP